VPFNENGAALSAEFASVRAIEPVKAGLVFLRRLPKLPN
jgi:hypothetical protein